MLAAGAMQDAPAIDWTKLRHAFGFRVLRADLGNFFFWQFREVDGFLISGKNSGTHWVKFMLSVALAHSAGVAPPTHTSGRAADAVIGHPRWGRQHADLPFIGSSHSIPSGAFAWRLAPFRPPPVVVLVRDIRDALLSNYVKWRDDYGMSLGEFARCWPTGRKLVADVWWYIHFFNRWGDVAAAWPGRVLFVRYEDVRADPGTWLMRMAAHFGVTLGAEDVAAALPYRAHEAVRAKLDPGETEIVIPEAELRRAIRFSDADLAYLGEVFRRFLRHDLGYSLREAP